MSDAQTYSGADGYDAGVSDFNALDAHIRSVLTRVETATLVRVQAVTPVADDGTGGTVDVLPLVAQITSAGSATPHGMVYGLPYVRLQGGANAIILDPQVGDLGLAVFASRDISSVKATKGPANPGSRRKFSMADGVYVGGLLNGTPTQIVSFTDAGITIKSPNKVMIEAAGLDIKGPVTMDGTLAVSGMATLATARISDILFAAHQHLSTQPGTPTGVPIHTP